MTINQSQVTLAIVLIGFLIAVGIYFGLFKKRAMRPIPAKQSTWQIYTTPPDKAAGGNFRFRYPPELYIYYDELNSPEELKPRKVHTIVLRQLRDRNIKTMSVDQKGFLSVLVIEINNILFRQCKDYTHSVEIKGVPIGTNSDDSDFLLLFDKIVKSFEVLE